MYSRSSDIPAASTVSTSEWRRVPSARDPASTAGLLQRLGRFVEGIHGARDVDELHRLFARSIRSFVDIERVSIALLKGSPAVSGTITVRAFSGHGVFPEGIQLDLTGSAIKYAMDTRVPLAYRSDDDVPFHEAEPLYEQGLKSILIVPLLANDRVFGTLNMAKNDDPFTDDEVAVLVQIATHIASSHDRLDMLDQIRSEADLHKEHALKMAAVANFARRLVAIRSQNELFAVLPEEVCALFGCARSSFVLVDADRLSVRVVGKSGVGAIKEGQAIAVSGSSFEALLSSAQPIFTSDFAHSSHPEHAVLVASGLRASVAIPIVLGGVVQGGINIAFTEVVAPGEALAAMLKAVANVTESTMERLRAEEALRDAQKSESLGLLAGGLAHDFNNLLGVALGNLSVVESLLPEEADVLEDIAQVRLALERSSRLTRQMLAYAGRGATKTERIDLNTMTQEICGLLSASLPKKIELHFELSARQPIVEVDAAQLQQVVVNLMTNAADAIGEVRGSIRLETSLERLALDEPSSLIPGHTLAAGPYVRLMCEDTGCGMPPEVVSRMFEPYFSTKSTGHGLGLAAVLGIVREHGGDLRVRSEPGRGTTVELLLPQGQCDSLRRKGQPSRGLALVIDDEEMMRRAARRMLTVLGFETIEARDGLEGLEVFQREANRLRLVLTDQSMPRMSGTDAIARMRATDCPAPIDIILMTGFDRERSMRSLSSDDVLGVLQKPFRLEHLREMLRDF